MVLSADRFRGALYETRVLAQIAQRRYAYRYNAAQITGVLRKSPRAPLVRARFIVAVLNYAIKFDRATACLHFQTARLLA